MLNLHADGHNDDNKMIGYEYIDGDDDMLLTEPMTFRLRIQRSTNWAIPTFLLNNYSGVLHLRAQSLLKLNSRSLGCLNSHAFGMLTY